MAAVRGGASSFTHPPASALPAVRDPRAPEPGTVLGPHYAHCFACGDEHETGLHQRMTVLDGVAVRCEFVVTEFHEGAPGLAHGGVLAAALDEAQGSLCWLMWTPAVTGRLEVDYVAPVAVGRTLVIDAHCSGVDGRRIYTEAVGRLDGPDGDVAVRGNGLFVAVGVEHFEKHGRGLHSELGQSNGRFNP